MPFDLYSSPTTEPTILLLTMPGPEGSTQPEFPPGQQRVLCLLIHCKHLYKIHVAYCSKEKVVYILKLIYIYYFLCDILCNVDDGNALFAFKTSPSLELQNMFLLNISFCSFFFSSSVWNKPGAVPDISNDRDDRESDPDSFFDRPWRTETMTKAYCLMKP